MRNTEKAMGETEEIKIIKLAGRGKDRYQEGGEIYEPKAAVENRVIRTRLWSQEDSNSNTNFTDQ